MTKLECPHCHVTLPISAWNEEVKKSVSVGVAEEIIPINIEPDEWAEWRDRYGGRTDCPECGEVCVFDDMEAY